MQSMLLRTYACGIQAQQVLIFHKCNQMSEYKVVTNNIYSIFLYSANSIIMNPSDISVQIRGIKLITFGFRFYQETSGFVISNIAVLMKTKNNYDIINRKINTKMN
jgi:hypothetical protein